MIIGIPVHNDLPSLKLMFESLLSSTNAYDKIIINDSESDEDTKEFLEFLNQKYKNVVIINSKKEGSVKATNDIMEIALKEKQDIFITHADVIFPKKRRIDWLMEMKEIAKNETCGMITCWNGGGISDKSYIEGFIWVGTWCCYIPYRALLKVGMFDLNYANGWGTDIDYTVSILKNNLKIYMTDYWVDHHMLGNRIHDYDEKGKQEASKYFKQKWEIK